MKVSLECTYCGYKWNIETYNKEYLRDKSCEKRNCGHRVLVMRDLDSKTNYYEGSPPFPIILDIKGFPEYN